MPSQSKQLLIIGHAPSPNAQSLCNALLEGAQDKQIETVSSKLKSPFDTTATDVLNANAIILFTTENFGYMNGALKDFFERVYYPCLEQPELNEAKAYSLVVKAGLDGTGATNSVQKIIVGLKWREAAPVLLCKGKYTKDFEAQCYEHAFTVAASLDANLI